MRLRALILLYCIGTTVLPSSAQGFPRNTPGITVSGYATRLGHADSMPFSASVLTSSGSQSVDADLAALVATLRGIGISDAAYTDMTDAPVEMKLITGTLKNPGTAGIKTLLEALSNVAPHHPGLTVQDVQAAFLLNNCAPLETALQVSAVADAHRRAERLAAAAHVALGVPLILTQGALPNYQFPCSRARSFSPIARLAGIVTPDGEMNFGLFIDINYSFSKPRS